MNTNTIALIAILSPAFFALTTLASLFQPGLRPMLVKKLATISSVVSIFIAAISGYAVVQYGMVETATIGFKGVGLSLRLDTLSTLMFGMIALLGFVVVRYSQNYLDGDNRQGTFMGRLSLAIAAVQLLVLAGNLGLLLVAWILTSMALHKLLIFYHERPGAIIAARKKYVVARLSDVSLLAAIIVLFSEYGTGNLTVIFDSIQASIANGTAPVSLELAAIFFVGAALFKSAQFPTHGWLIEVMETPTPVSSLLHAGLLNAGPFLIIRMAFVLDATTYAPITLMIVGGFTALFASVVYLTQTAVKTALGYSSVAHMGFSLMVCGLGIYPAAMLHLVSHSFYKAHSFLSSGSVVDTLRSSKVRGTKRLGSPVRIILGMALAVSVFIGFAMIWGVNFTEDLGLLAIGAVIALGLTRLYTSALDSTGSINMMTRIGLLSLVVAAAFFSLESAMHAVLADELPEMVAISTGKMVVMGVVLALMATVIFIQIASPAITKSEKYQTLAIHVKNGFYVNTLFDRVVRTLSAHGSQSQPVFIEHEDVARRTAYKEVEQYEEQPA